MRVVSWDGKQAVMENPTEHVRHVTTRVGAHEFITRLEVGRRGRTDVTEVRWTRVE